MIKNSVNKFQNAHEEGMLHLKKAKMQIEEIIGMVEYKKNCITVINRSKAVQFSLGKASSLLLENHLLNCVADFKKGVDSKHFIEIMKIFKAYRKRS